jgi:conjugal transfer pilus assembly protein TraE
MRWEEYRAGKKEHGFLKFVILTLTLGILAEGVFLLWFVRQERIVLVPAGIHEEAKSWISRTSASPDYLEQMTLYLLPLVTNFHPRTLDAQFALFLRYVAPDQYGAVKVQLLSQAERVRRNEFAQVFYVQQVEIKEGTARATGILQRFVGKTKTSEEIATYEITYEIRYGRPVVVGIHLVPPVGMGPANGGRS